jgi:hypothetical protein
MRNKVRLCGGISAAGVVDIIAVAGATAMVAGAEVCCGCIIAASPGGKSERSRVRLSPGIPVAGGFSIVAVAAGVQAETCGMAAGANSRRASVRLSAGMAGVEGAATGTGTVLQGMPPEPAADCVAAVSPEPNSSRNSVRRGGVSDAVSTMVESAAADDAKASSFNCIAGVSPNSSRNSVRRGRFGPAASADAGASSDSSAVTRDGVTTIGTGDAGRLAICGGLGVTAGGSVPLGGVGGETAATGAC